MALRDDLKESERRFASKRLMDTALEAIAAKPSQGYRIKVVRGADGLISELLMFPFDTSEEKAPRQ